MKPFTQTRYATVASTAALVVALGGTSYAAVAVTGAQIKDGTVTTSDVKNKSLKLKDLAPAAQTKLKGQPGPTGPKGAAGPSGPAGPVGPTYARYAHDDTDTNITNQVSGDDPVVIATAPLGLSSYVLLGKVIVNNTSAVTTTVRCTLAAQSDTDLATVRLAAGTTATLSLQVGHTFTGLGGLSMIRCYSFGNSGLAQQAKLTMVKVASLDPHDAG